MKLLLLHPLRHLALAALAALAATNASLAAVTTESIMQEMTDMRALAHFPSPAYTCKQFSSYDRKSKSPEVEWFANGDAGQFLRVEESNGRKEYVMADAEGPGAVVRIWSANPAGTIRIYLDGAATPVIETAMTDLLGGKFAGLPKPIAGEYSKGWNLYFPIPYARHCKITSDKGGFYYHVNYRTYEAGTKVETFNKAQLAKLEASIQKLATALTNSRGDEARLGGEIGEVTWEIPAGGTKRSTLKGPAAYTFSVLRVTATDLQAALRGTILKVAFDGEPCIEVPLGDYFGSAPGINAFATLPMGMTKDGEMYAHWFMPFKESAEIELINHTSQSVTLHGRSGLTDYTWTDSSMHFHAKWRAQLDVPTRPMIDWNYLTATGKGVFVGVSFSIDNPVKDWWGEGDEKIYVDGEKFPSHFGTGTEDYFGYAWCWPGLFTHAYHAQPRCDGPGNYGRTSVNRFHVVDAIPFTKDFKFDMELWHWHQSCKVNMAVVSYWYARPGATDTFAGIRAEETMIRPMAQYTPPRVAGAIEGEALKIVNAAGKAEPQDWPNISGDQQLWWHAGMKPGDTLTVAFAAPKAGKFQVLGRFLSAKDYGVHQFAVNGTPAGQPRDFYNPEVKPTREIELGVFNLKEGENQLSVTVVGANEKAVKAYMLGLDYLKLKEL